MPRPMSVVRYDEWLDTFSQHRARSKERRWAQNRYCIRCGLKVGDVVFVSFTPTGTGENGVVTKVSQMSCDVMLPDGSSGECLKIYLTKK